MATLEDAAETAMSLPGVSEGERWGTQTWLVAKKDFAWLVCAPTKLAEEYLG